MRKRKIDKKEQHEKEYSMSLLDDIFLQNFDQYLRVEINVIYKKKHFVVKL